MPLPLCVLLSVMVLTAGLYAGPAAAQDASPEQQPSEERVGSESGTPEEESEPAVTELDEITVSASYSLNRDTPVDGVALSRDQIVDLPTFADDIFRAINLVPGTSGDDVSAAFSVRGAPYEEVLVRLDGVELFEPFHLKDFSGALSILDGELIDGIDIFPGAFPAVYGDRSAGVVDLTSRRPLNTKNRAGISLTTATLSRGQRFGDNDRGSGLLSLRRGWLDVVFGLVGEDDEEEEEGAPEYADFYGKADWAIDESTDIGVWGLWADDSLEQTETEEDGTRENVNSSYGNAWLVGRGQRLWSSTALSTARVLAGRVDRDRIAGESEGSTDFDVRDNRQLDIFGFSTESSLELGRHLLDFGFEARSYTADYDYAVARSFTDPVSQIGGTAPVSSFLGEVSGESYAAWISDRFRLGDRLVAEVGLRYDRQTWLPETDDQIAPRLNVVYDLGDAGALRAGWGYAHQSQRPNELQVQDGDFNFYAAERAEHRTLGWERPFEKFSLRLDAYQRLGTDVRPRFINLFSPTVLFPEGTPDRLRIEPDRTRAQGVELFLQGRGNSRFTWWASYSWSESEQRVGGEWIPVAIDQTHAVTLSAGYQLGRWKLDAVWQYHTGWPVTALDARLDADGDIEPLPGPIYGDRVDDYHRLDLRLSRQFSFSWADMLLYFDIQNAYNRDNVRGFEYGPEAFSVGDDGAVAVTPTVDEWLGVIPSFGVTWSF
ncbi:MAG: TonB-dependent receptor [Acidobacteriota bacterium]